MSAADDLLDGPVTISADKFLDQGGTDTSIADKFLDGDNSMLDKIKTGVKAVASVPMMAMRGYEAMGVGGAKLIAGEKPQEALARAAEATQPGFEPKGIAENVGSFVGGSAPLMAIPVGEAAVGTSRAAKLLHAAKIGGLFGLGTSTLQTLENKGSITMDDAEHIATSGVLNAAMGATFEGVLGPVMDRLFKRKIGEAPVEPETPPTPPPDAPAHVVKNAEDLTQLLETKKQIEQHGEALSHEAQQMLGEINKEVDRLNKLDKTYMTKQMIKEVGINLEDQTPAKAEEIITRASKPRFRVAAKTDKGIIIGDAADVHGTIERPKNSKLLDMGFVDMNEPDPAAKFYTREEAAKAINPDYEPGDALHSQPLKDLTQEQFREEQLRVSQSMNARYSELKGKGTDAEARKLIATDPTYQKLKARDMEIHKFMAPPAKTPKVVEPIAEVTKAEEPKLKDFTPAVETNKGVTKGAPGQEHDDIIAQNNFDIVLDEVKEGYVRNSDGKFLTKEEVLGPTEAPEGGKIPERTRLLNQWAEETATAAKDLGYKTSKEALAWAEKSHHHLNDDYKLAFQNKFQSLIKAEPVVTEPIKPSKAIVSATPIEVGESAPILKASEMMDGLVKELPPTAGVNPEVADVIDSARAATVSEKPKAEITPEGTFKTLHEDATVKIVNHEVLTDNQLKIKEDTAKSSKVKDLKVPANVLQASPNLPGTEMAPAFIPEYIAGSSQFRLGWYSRVAKAAQSVLEDMGNSGKELAARIKMVDDASKIRASNFLYNFDQAILKIPKNQREKAGIALMDILEGRKTDFKGLPEDVTKLVQNMFGDFADDAKKLDFHILRADGEKVPWAERANFAPRVVKQEFVDGILRGDGVTLGRVKQYMLETKQATTDIQASQKVQALRRRYMERRYGHLERAREYDLPPEFYDRQGFTVIPEYVRAASHRLEEVRQFGQHDLKVIQLLEGIAGEGKDAILARQIFDRYAGLEVGDEVHARLVQGVRNLTTGMALQFPSTVSQLGQFLTPIHRATSPELGYGLMKSYGRAASAFMKAFTSLGHEEATRAGQGFESTATDFLLDTYSGTRSKPFGKFAEVALKYSGFSAEDSFLRRYSAILGRNYIKDELIPRILKNSNNKFAVTELRRLGLNPSIVKVQGGLSDFELNLATKRFTDQTQGSPDVLSLPLWWTSPTGKFWTQFHSFSVVVGKENYLLAKDMLKTGNINRLISLGLGTPLVGAGISYIKEDILGLKPNDFTGDKQTDQILRWYINGTSFGVAADLMLNLIKSRSAFTGSFAVPSINILSGLAYDTKAALLQGDKKAAKRVAQKIPVVGRVLFQ